MKMKFNSYMFWYSMGINPVLPIVAKIFDLAVYFMFATALFSIATYPIVHFLTPALPTNKSEAVTNLLHIYGLAAIPALVWIVVGMLFSCRKATTEKL